MIFTRIVPALLVAVVSAQALYIPDVLYAREFEEFSELSERGLDQLEQVVHDIIARDFVNLGLRSDSDLSSILVTRTGSRSPSPGPYECKNKADCQKHIDYADHQIAQGKPEVAKCKAALKAAKKGTPAYRTAKNELHTAEGSLASWEENKEEYEKMKRNMKT